MLRERKLLPKRLKLMAKYEKLCVHKEKKYITFFCLTFIIFCSAGSSLLHTGFL